MKEKPHPEWQNRSDCCGAPVRIECDDDLGSVGTCHYECTACDKTCDAVRD